MYGIQRQEKAAELKSLTCGMCQAANAPKASFCFKCGYALNISGVVNTQTREASAEDLLERFLKRPEAKRLFKKMIQEERNNENSDNDEPPPPAPRPKPPSGGDGSSPEPQTA